MDEATQKEFKTFAKIWAVIIFALVMFIFFYYGFTYGADAPMAFGIMCVLWPGLLLVRPIFEFRGSPKHAAALIIVSALVIGSVLHLTMPKYTRDEAVSMVYADMADDVVSVQCRPLSVARSRSIYHLRRYILIAYYNETDYVLLEFSPVTGKYWEYNKY